jgi:hypothetical protein
MSLNCRHCDVKLFGPEVDAGVCENCQRAPAPPRPVPFAHLGARRDGQEEWRPVARGLFLLFWGTAGALLVWAVNLGLAVFAAADAYLQAAPFVSGAGLLVASVVGAGALFCCRARRPHLLPLRWLTAIFTVAYLLTLAALTAWLWWPRAGVGAPIAPPQGRDLSPLIFLLAPLGLFAFLSLGLLLLAIAWTVGARDLARKFIIFLIASLVGPLAVMLFACGIAAVVFRDWDLAVLTGLACGLLFAVGVGLWFLALLSELRELVSPIEP